MTRDPLKFKTAPEMRAYPMRLELAGYYSDDAFDFYRRYKMTFYSDFRNMKSRRAKAYVDLRMAVEALLKALICLRAPRNLAGRRLVGMVRRYSHRIELLKADALKGLRIEKRFTDAIDKCAIAPVDLRYQFDAMTFREPDDRLYYQTIGCDAWLATLEEFVAQGIKRLRTALARRSKIVSADIVVREERDRPSDYTNWRQR